MSNYAPYRYRTKPTAVRAIQYHAPQPDHDYPGNVDAVAQFLGHADTNHALNQAPGLTPSPRWSEDFVLIVTLDPGSPDLTLPPEAVLVEHPDGTYEVLGAGEFVHLYQKGGVAELETLSRRELENRLDDADVKIERSIFVPAAFSHSDDRMFADSDVVDLYTEPHAAGHAAVEMFVAAGLTGMTVEKLKKMGAACSQSRTADPDDDDWDDPELAREELQGVFARRGFGWLVECQWASRTAYGSSVGFTWGITTHSWHWGETFFEAVEAGIAAAQAEYQEARDEAAANRAETREAIVADAVEAAAATDG